MVVIFLGTIHFKVSHVQDGTRVLRFVENAQIREIQYHITHSSLLSSHNQAIEFQMDLGMTHHCLAHYLPKQCVNKKDH